MFNEFKKQRIKEFEMICRYWSYGILSWDRSKTNGWRNFYMPLSQETYGIEMLRK